MQCFDLEFIFFAGQCLKFAREATAVDYAKQEITQMHKAVCFCSLFLASLCHVAFVRVPVCNISIFWRRNSHIKRLLTGCAPKPGHLVHFCFDGFILGCSQSFQLKNVYVIQKDSPHWASLEIWQCKIAANWKQDPCSVYIIIYVRLTLGRKIKLVLLYDEWILS